MANVLWCQKLKYTCSVLEFEAFGFSPAKCAQTVYEKTDFLLKQVSVLGAEFQRIQKCFKSVLVACGVSF